MTILSIVIVARVLILLSLRVQVEQLNTILNEHNRNVAAEISNHVEDLVDHLEYLAGIENFVMLDTEIQMDLLTGLIEQHNDYEIIAVLDRSGTVVTAVSPAAQPPLHRLPDVSGLLNALTGQESYIGPITVDPATGQPFVTLAVPIRNRFGEIETVLVANLKLTFLCSIICQAHIGYNGRAYIIDNRYYLTPNPDDPSTITTNPIAEHPFIKTLPTDLGQVAEGIPAASLFPVHIGLNGDEVLRVKTPVPDLGWQIVAELPSAEPYAPLSQTLWIMGIVLGLALIVAVVLGLFLSRRIVSPLQHLTEAATQISAGNLDIELNIQRSDEVGILGAAFSRMTIRLRRLISSLRQEITERQRAEETLREIAANMAAAQQIAHFGSWEISLNAALEFISPQLWSDECYRIFGVEPRSVKITEEYFYRCVHPDDREFAAQALRRAIEERAEASYEYRLIWPDGSIRYVYDQVNIILDDETGRPVKVVGTVHDITERKQVEVERDAIFQRNQALVQAFGEIVYEWRPLQNEVDWHGDYERILGYTAAEIGHNTDSWTSRVHPDDLERVLQEVDEAGNERRMYNMEYRFRRRDGSYCWMHDQGILFFNPQGELEKMIGVFRNISQRKQIEEQFYQAQKMESIGRLAGGIAHDFNNILVPIIGYVELGMMNLAPDAKLYADLKRVREAAERAASLTRQILAFSRKQVLEMRVLDLNVVVADFENMVQRLIGEDIELQAFLDPALCLVNADQGQIEQTLLNLVINARDAMPNGGKLTIETAKVYLDEAYIKKHGGTYPPNHYAMLAVSDTGHGMDVETQQQIFEPFFTTKEQGKGTGLGLATVFGIVKQHGGNIWVYSEPDKGTTFKIYLPQAEGIAQTPDTTATELASIYGTETVLVVEDDEMVRKLVCETLEAHGYEVIEAQSPDDGLQLASAKDNIHLLVTDVIMPEMNGRDLYQKVDTVQSGIKVLYMSGYTDNVIVHHGILDEGVSFLQKPFTVQSLVQKVRRVLS